MVDWGPGVNQLDTSQTGDGKKTGFNKMKATIISIFGYLNRLRSNDGAWLDIRLHGNNGYDAAGAINECINIANGELYTILIPPGTYPIISNVEIPSNITLYFLPGGKFNISNATITINGGIKAGLYKIFEYEFDPQKATDSCVKLGTNHRVKEVYPEWFGAVADATWDTTAESGQGGYIGTDCTDAFNKALGVFVPDMYVDRLGVVASDRYRTTARGTVKVNAGIYLIQETILHSFRSTIEGQPYYTRSAVNLIGNGSDSTCLVKGNRTTSADPILYVRACGGPRTLFQGFKCSSGYGAGTAAIAAAYFESCDGIMLYKMWTSGCKIGLKISSCTSFIGTGLLAENNTDANYYVNYGAPRLNCIETFGTTTDHIILDSTNAVLTDARIHTETAVKNSGLRIIGTTSTTTLATNITIECGNKLNYGVLIEGAEKRFICSNLIIADPVDNGIKIEKAFMVLNNATIDDVATGLTKGSVRSAIYCSDLSGIVAKNLNIKGCQGEIIRGLNLYHLDIDNVTASNITSYLSNYVFFIQNQSAVGMGGNYSEALISINNVGMQAYNTSNPAIMGIYIDSASTNVHFNNIDFASIPTANTKIARGSTYGGLSKFSGPHDSRLYRSHGATSFPGNIGDASFPFPSIYDRNGAEVFIMIRQVGTTAQRPTLAANVANTGFLYYDTTLGKPIWWSGSAWKDASGTIV
jgi:hypothetical protein